MAGESLETAELREAGVAGDRIVQVRNATGRIITARTRPLLLRHHATLTVDNQVLIDGHPWNAMEVARDVETAAGTGTRLVMSRTPMGRSAVKDWSGSHRDGRPPYAVHHDYVRSGLRPARLGGIASDPEGVQRQTRTQRICCHARPCLCSRCC